MKACVYYKPAKIRLEERAKPSLNSESVLIRVKACGICGSDLHLFRHPPVLSTRFLKYLASTVSSLVKRMEGRVLGHEISGEVVEIGDNVEEDMLNQHVIVYPKIACGHCQSCKNGYEHLCEFSKNVGRELDGGFAEYVSVPKRVVVRTTLSPEEGVMVEPLSCALHAVKSCITREVENVAILGAGTMGLLILQVLKLFNVPNILITDISNFKLEIAKKLGATLALNAKNTNIRREISTISPKMDVVFECVGGEVATKTLNQALELVRPRGKICIVGALTTSVKLRLGVAHLKEVQLISSYTSTFKDYLEALDIISKKKVQTKILITQAFPLEKCVEAFKKSLSGEGIKTLIIPS
ncbi:MAG: alcohol dehydrogenase catalytic domain-containing protein [Thermofilaceae archaeon]